MSIEKAVDRMKDPRYLTKMRQAVIERWIHLRNNQRILWMAAEIARHSPSIQGNNELRASQQSPVVFFNSSTRLSGMSLNAAFSLLTSWALQLQDVPVIHFVCQAGMSRCVLGSRSTVAPDDNFDQPPPCRACMAQSRVNYAHSQVVALNPASAGDIRYGDSFQQDAILSDLGLNIEQLTQYQYQDIPLGKLVLPGIRWVLRRHHLVDDAPTRYLYREYIRSGYHIAREFTLLLNHARPQAVILFNGQFFPEATARWVALQCGIRVITHEVGLQPNSAFFTDGEATAYPLQIPEEFELSPEQDARLDAYLSNRFQGKFSMAGIQFWPEMRRLETDFLEKAAQFRQLVPVFTNVIFDTSQPHSNVLFPHMLAWLDQILGVIRRHPETLFILRAHPDENRPGKASRESVRQWVWQNQVLALPNVVFYDSGDTISSYELVQRAKFNAVYNSTIGLEASILGAPVLCGGRARFTQLPTVFFPQTAEAYLQQFENFLNAETIPVPAEFQRNARRFLYYQLFKSSLPFTEYIEPDGVWRGFVKLKSFPWQKLSPQFSPTMQVLVDGILSNDSTRNGTPFLLSEENENLYD